MFDTTLTVTLTLKGPILTQSTAGRILWRKRTNGSISDGLHYLAGTLIKGRLRQSLNELYEAAGGAFTVPIDRLFGSATGSLISVGSSVKAIRGLLRFTDFIHLDQSESQTMYRIRMDEVRGAVARGAFQVIEAPFAPGARIDFTGTIRYIAQDQNEADTIRRYIELGLRWTTSFGADRTVGFGQLIEVDVKQKSNFLAQFLRHP